MKLILTTALMIMGLISHSNGQNSKLEDYKWKNRLVLVLTENFDSETLLQQLKILNNKKELDERKIKVIVVLPGQHLVLDNSNLIEQNGTPNSASDLFYRFRETATGFSVILIGLDGGVKLKQNNVVTSAELFNTIDSMPMRRAEIKN